MKTALLAIAAFLALGAATPAVAAPASAGALAPLADVDTLGNALVEPAQYYYYRPRYRRRYYRPRYYYQPYRYYNPYRY